MLRWASIVLLLSAGFVLYATSIPGGDDGRLLFGMWRASGIGAALALAAGALACALASRSRRALMAYVFAWMLALTAVALLELVALTGLVSYPVLMGNELVLRTNDLGSKVSPHLDVRGTTRQDTATGWGLDSEPVPFHYQTDRRGFRNPSDPETADIYLLGDSVVVGALVPFDQTVASQLALDTGRSTLNIALIGLSPQGEIDLFHATDPPLRGRLVLHFLFEGNDLIDSWIYRTNDGGTWPADTSLRTASFTDNAIRALQRLTQPTLGLARRRMCTIDGQDYTFRWTFSSYRSVAAEQSIVLDAIADFASEVRAAGGEYAVVFVPTKLRALGPQCDSWPADSDLVDQIDANPLRATLQTFAEQSGIPVVDLTDALRAASAGGRQPWFWADTHWNAHGHAVAAEAIAEAPITQRWLRDPLKPEAASGAIGSDVP